LIGDSGTNGLYKGLVEVQTRDVWRKECSRSDSFLGLRKGRRGSGAGFLSIALLILYRAGLRVLWHSITGGVKLTAPTEGTCRIYYQS